ncbi:MAG: DNA repair protein RecN [Bacteroidaceae bacterium]|nr:DNA repair protein RecN [Bacteroidaceae bacterium]
MLQTLHIQNYALIDRLDIDFESGFSVITGETGAGKSIILGAIGLLLGKRADSKSIKTGASKCVIEAHFNLSAYHLQDYFEEKELEYDGDECIMRRELSASGKSRSFINDVPASLNQMKELGEQLIDVHSQHQNLLLGKEDFQLNVVDIIANNANDVGAYRQTFAQWKNLTNQLDLLMEEADKSRADEDYLSFQLEQLEQLNLKEGEQKDLEAEADRLSHAEEIKSGLYAAGQYLCHDEGSGVLCSLKDVLRHLRDIARVYPEANEWQERIESCHIELKDICDEVESALDEVEFNPARMEEVNDRLNQLYTLEHKHHLQTDKELLTLAEDLRTRLDAITSYDERITDLKKEIQTVYNQLLKQAAALTDMRKKAAKHIEQQLTEHLIPLGMPNVQFHIAFTNRKEPDNHGMDSVVFLFSANKNSQLQDIAHVASGGEIARVMLSLKALIAGAVKLPTIIFDEIDTGVSGKIAERMALIMQEMGNRERQVISITHLPQIAARGNAHYRVYKEDTETGTTSHLTRLNDEERITEIAHMLSGENLTEAAMENARELLKRE